MNINYFFSKFIKYIQIPSVKNSVINKKSKICPKCNIINTKIDKYTYIGTNTTIVESEIGSFCSISDNCVIGGASHPIDWVSTSPVFYKGRNIFKTNFSENEFESYSKTIIGNDVWIGTNCLIKSGIKIGNGSIVGMGSVVTKNINDFEIWAGNPAKFIKKRFDNNSEVSNIKWWNLEDDILKEYAKYFNDTKLLCEKLK